MTTIWFAVVVMLGAGSTFAVVAAIGLRRQIARLQQGATEIRPVLSANQQQNQIQTTTAQLRRFPVS